METYEAQIAGLAARSASFGPHSLGKSIEWKLEALLDRKLEAAFSPHSLGKSIEWKPFRVCFIQRFGIDVPTRWGNQLNGNEC